jgi:hypothetical protein
MNPVVPSTAKRLVTTSKIALRAPKRSATASKEAQRNSPKPVTKSRIIELVTKEKGPARSRPLSCLINEGELTDQPVTDHYFGKIEMLSPLEPTSVPLMFASKLYVAISNGGSTA